MFSSSMYSASQLVVYLNEASTSLGNLKTCLCAGRAARNNKTHNKLASTLSRSSSHLASHRSKTTSLPIDLPIGWLEHMNIANTKTDFSLLKAELCTQSDLQGKLELESSPWRTLSYTSAESFLLNKQGMFRVLHTPRLMPLYSQRMPANRKLFVQSMQQKRHVSMFSQQIMSMEAQANRQPNDSDVQVTTLFSFSI